jgi:hypothetical protein
MCRATTDAAALAEDCRMRVLLSADAPLGGYLKHRDDRHRQRGEEAWSSTLRGAIIAERSILDPGSGASILIIVHARPAKRAGGGRQPVDHALVLLDGLPYE